VQPLSNGQLLEYVVEHPDMKRPVDFDGHLFRGDPPVEVFQEIKGDYSFFIEKLKKPELLLSQIQKWVENQAARQLNALADLAPGAKLEWVFTRNEDIAELFRDAVEDQGLPIDVRFVPINGE
jgi:hypothetical protein